MQWTIFFALFLVTSTAVAKRLPWWAIKIAQDQGPNACVVEEVPNTNKKYWTECKYWINRKICGVKTVVRYECCEGYERIEGEKGCTGVKQLKNLLETALDLGATKFIQYARDSGLTSELEKEGTFTLFVPTNDAFDEISERLRLQLESPNRNGDPPVILYHFVDGRVHSKQFKADKQIISNYQKTSLRINKYSNGMNTVNCKLIVRKDLEATNGIIHLIDGVLDPHFFIAKNTEDVITQDERFKEFSDAIRQMGGLESLKDADGGFTLFAPSDEAFQKIKSAKKDKLMKDRDARNSMVNYHLVHHTMCLPAIIEEHKVRTLEGEKIKLTCTKRGTFVQDTKLRANDYVLTKNGIIYVLDDVLYPNRAKNLMELAENSKLWTFLSLARTAGLEETFTEFGDYTLFVPSEEAFRDLDPQIIAELRQDPIKAKKLILFHGTQGRIPLNQITDNQVVMSLDEENPLRLQVYRKAFGVENAMIDKSDMIGQNGVMHVIDKVLFPANQSAGDLLRKNGSFSIFLQAMEKVSEDNRGVLDLHSPSAIYTFFVPTDEAFQKLRPIILDRILGDKNFRAKVIMNHIAKGIVSTHSLKEGLHYVKKTLLNTVAVAKKQDVIKVEDARIVSENIMNANGVIQVIDKVLIPDNGSNRL